MLMNILKLVESALTQKPQIQKLVDVVTGYFVPVVMVIATITFIFWLIIGGMDGFYNALRNLVTVLVVACPCGMGLATPTAITVGIGVGS